MQKACKEKQNNKIITIAFWATAVKWGNLSKLSFPPSSVETYIICRVPVSEEMTLRHKNLSFRGKQIAEKHDFSFIINKLLLFYFNIYGAPIKQHFHVIIMTLSCIVSIFLLDTSIKKAILMQIFKFYKKVRL